MPISSAARTDVTNRSACIRNSILIADSSTAWFFGGTGYEVIDEGPQQDELTDRKPRYRYKYQATRPRMEHPTRIWYEPPCGCRIRKWWTPSCSWAPITKTVWPHSG